MGIKSFKNHRVLMVHETQVDAYREAAELALRMIQHDLDTDPGMSKEDRADRIQTKSSLNDLIIALERSI